MRRRLYFLLPDLDTARKVVDELLLARIEERHIHVLAKEDTELQDLPKATLFQKSDFVHAVERGLALGGGTGVWPLSRFPAWYLAAARFSVSHSRGPGWGPGSPA